MPTPTLTLVVPRDAAEFLHLSESTLAKMRMTGIGPRFRKHGRKVVYAQSDLEEWSDFAVSLNTLKYEAQVSRNKARATRAKMDEVIAKIDLERAAEKSNSE